MNCGAMKKATSVTDLHNDLLQEITSVLSLADQVRFRFVCQKFLSLPLNIRAIHKLPWLVNWDESETDTKSQILWNLYDPIHEKPYSSCEISIKRDNKPFKCCITSKDGWVFFGIGADDSDRTSFILFSPFTKQIIKLPDLVHKKWQRGWGKTISFTSDPTSKECVFYFMFSSPTPLRDHPLSIYMHGDKKWYTIPMGFSRNPEGPKDIGRIMCFNKHLCYYFKRGIAVFILDPSFGFHCGILWPTESEREYTEYFLVGLNGELLVVCTTKRRDMWGVYVLNKLTYPQNWVAKKSLPNTALFVADNIISVPASGEFKHIENKIFYYDSSEEKSMFYSIIDDKTYEDTEFLVRKHHSKGYWIDSPPHVIAKL